MPRHSARAPAMSPRNSSVSARRQRSGAGTRAGASAHCASSQSSSGLTLFSGKPLSRIIWLSHSVSCKAGSSRLNSAASKGINTARCSAPAHRWVKV